MAEPMDMDALGDEELEARIARGDFVGDDAEEMEARLNPTDEDEEEEEEEDGTDDTDDTDEDDQEGEDEDEDLEEDQGESEEDEVEEDDDDSIMIPKSRLDEVIAQREESRAREAKKDAQIEKLMEMFGQQQKPEPKQEKKAPTFDFAEQDAKIAEAILSDDKMLAEKLRRERDKASQEILDFQTAKAKEEAVAQARAEAEAMIEAQKVEALVETYEETYPFLNKNDPSANQDAIDMVNLMMTGLLADGERQSVALRKAVKKVAPLFQRAAPAPAQKSTRKPKAIKKNVQASKKQAPKGRSSRVSKEAVMNPATMSRKAWANLSEREKAVMRGDIIE